MAIYAIGDLQGSAREFDDLLIAIDFSVERDECWLVGDLVNRGDDSLGVLRRLEQLGPCVRAVLGNHDLHALAVGFGVAKLKHQDTIQDILNDARKDHWLEYLLKLPLMVENNSWVMVHAGIPPEWDLATLRQETQAVHQALQSDPAGFLSQMYGDQPTRYSADLAGMDRARYCINALTRMRYVNANGDILSTPKGPPHEAPAELTPWYLATRQALGKRVVFGHWSALGLYQDANVLCLDSGCAWGFELTAQRLDSNLDQPEPAIQVPSRGPGKSFT